MKFVKIIFIILFVVMLGSVASAWDTTSNLVFYYNLDETTGDLTDYSANNYDTNIINGTPTYSQSGIVGNSILYDGINEAHEYQHPVGLYDTGTDHSNLSMFVWAKSTNPSPSTNQYIATISNDGISNIFFGLLILSGNWNMGLARQAGTRYCNVGTPPPVNDTDWHHIGFVKYSNEDWRFFFDGVNVCNNTVLTEIRDVDTTSIGKLQTSAGNLAFFNGSVDEYALWKLTALSQEQVTALYNCGVYGQNITSSECINEEPPITNTAPTPTLNQPLNNSNQTTSTVTLNYTYTDSEGDNGNCSLYYGTSTPPTTIILNSTNITNGTTITYDVSPVHNTTYYWYVNCTDGQLSNSSSVRQFYSDQYTAVEHFDVVIPQTSISSTTYVLIANGTFNQTTANALFPKFSFNMRKATLPQARSLSLKVVFNNNTIMDEVTNTVSGAGNYKSSAYILPEQSALIGENNFQIYGKIDASPGTIVIENLEFHTLTNKTEDAGSIGMSVQQADFNFSSTTYINVANFTINKSVNSTTYFDMTHKISASGTDTVYCYYQNEEVSSEYGRYLSGAGVYGSTGTPFYCPHYTDGELTIKLYCKSLLGTTVYNNVSFFAMDLVSNLGRTIPIIDLHNSSINFTNFTTLNAGDNIAFLLNNQEVYVGDEYEFSSMAILQSTTGEQTPKIYTKIENGMTWVSNNMSRTLSDNNDIGTARQYTSLDVVIGTIYNISQHVIVPTGESLKLLSQAMYGIAVTSLNLTGSNQAPNVVFINPTNATTVTGNETIEFLATDVNENLETCWTDLYYTNGTFYKNINTGATSSFIYDFSIEENTNFILETTCNDTLGLEGHKNITITVFNPESNIYDYTLATTPCSTGSEFNVVATYSCNGTDNCTVSYSFAVDSLLCTAQDNETGTIMVTNGSIDNTITVGYICVATIIPNFEANLTNLGDSVETQTTNVICSAGGGGGLTADESSCLLYGNLTSGELCSLGLLEGGIMNIGIMIFIGILIAVFAFATYYFDNELKLVFMFLTGLMTVVGLNLMGQFAEAYSTAQPIIDITWGLYRTSVICLYAFALYILVKLIVQLRIRKHKEIDPRTQKRIIR